jgi:hypothetical protein
MVPRTLTISTERGRKLRFDVVLKEMVNGIRKPEVILNRTPLRPANMYTEFDDLVTSQWRHHSYDGIYPYRWWQVGDPAFVYIFSIRETRIEGMRTHSFSIQLRQV